MYIRRISMEKLLFGDLEDCLNPVEELLDELQSAMEEFCENLSDFGDTIGEGLSYMKETVRRARERVGEEEYNLIFKNCEHFALWCKTGVEESTQVIHGTMQCLAFGLTCVLPILPFDLSEQ